MTGGEPAPLLTSPGAIDLPADTTHLAKARRELAHGPAFGFETRRREHRADDAIAIELAHRLQHRLGLRTHADHDIGERRGLEDVPLLAEHLGAQQQAGRAIRPEAIAVTQRIARPDRQHVGLVAGDTLAALGADVVPVADAVVARLQQRRKRAQHAALLDHRHLARRPDGLHDVVVPVDLALPAVERLDALVLVRPFAEVRDARARHVAAAADDEGSLEVAPAGGSVDAQQPGAHLALRGRH